MVATIRRLRTKADLTAAEEADQLRQLLKDRPSLPAKACTEILAALDQQAPTAPNEWPFVMVSPTQNREVVSWLRHNSHAPLVALDVWAELLTAMVWETGEVALTRDEIAANTGTRPNTISQIMGELESIGAISREREKIAGMRGPGRVKYIVNPTVCTHLTGPARVRAQAAALKLQVVSGGKA